MLIVEKNAGALEKVSRGARKVKKNGVRLPVLEENGGLVSLGLGRFFGSRG